MPTPSHKTGVLNRRTPVRIRTQTQSNLDRSQNQHSKWIMTQASFYWCVILRYIFFPYSMWFLSSVFNPEVQSVAVITTSLWQLTQCWPRDLWVTQVVCVKQRRQIDLRTVSQQTKIMACSNPDKKRKVDSKNREFKTEWTDKYAFVLPVTESTYVRDNV